MEQYCLSGFLAWFRQIKDLDFFGVSSHIINPLFTKLVRSRWLDIGLVLLLRVYGPNTQKKNLETSFQRRKHGEAIGHFRVQVCLLFKASLSAKFL